MLRIICKKRLQLLMLTFIMSTFLIFSTAFAEEKSVSQFVYKNSDATINIDRGIELYIQKNSMKEDTLISITMVERNDRLYFDFGPDGTTFKKNKPAELSFTNKVIKQYGLKDFALYGENGEVIDSEDTGSGQTWYISHFSIYYFRRR